MISHLGDSPVAFFFANLFIFYRGLLSTAYSNIINQEVTRLLVVCSTSIIYCVLVFVSFIVLGY